MTIGRYIRPSIVRWGVLVPGPVELYIISHPKRTWSLHHNHNMQIFIMTRRRVYTRQKCNHCWWWTVLRQIRLSRRRVCRQINRMSNSICAFDTWLYYSMIINIDWIMCHIILKYIKKLNAYLAFTHWTGRIRIICFFIRCSALFIPIHSFHYFQH